ncbi:MAG: TIGR01212 family radical SAM protein [Prevotellaceae bacterium]|nr:TIGR01212 family radical SAM protein [Prevotellaceae bacterium]
MKTAEHIYAWGDSRRFNSYAGYFKRTFGERIQKLTIDAGFTCPNRDGTVGVGGCTYCNNDAFNPSYCQSVKPITQQLDEGIEFHANRYRRATKFLAYFQAYSNTYAPLEQLKRLYNQALSYPNVIGLVIGTRPDCISEETLDYLAELSKQYYIIVEYGVESCYNRTLERINRGHTFEKAVWALEETKKRGIKTGAHFIFGLPNESLEDMIAETKIISRLPLDTVKFHQLQIIKGAVMEKEYALSPNEFARFTVNGYIDFFIDFVEHLSPSIVIERFAGEVPPRFLAAPAWGLIRNDQLLAMFEKRLEERNTWQGKLFL